MEQQTLLSVGQVVHTNLYNLGKGVIVNIHGEQKPQSMKNMYNVMVTGSNAEFDIVFFNGNKTNRLPESILHSVQWKIEDETVEQETIKSLIEKAEAHEQAENAEEEQKHKEFNQGVEFQKNNTEYSHLTQITSNSDNEVKIVGKNIRAELKKYFPKTKFSVRKQYYSSYHVTWTDGPTVDEVESIIKKYKTSRLDCYTDYSYNENSPFNVIYGGADYVFTNRHYSDEIIALAIKSLIEKYGECYEFDTTLMTIENYHQGILYKIGREQIIGNDGVGGEINRVLRKTSY
ncbi:LPD29 domain-containing protein [Providencia sp. PROV033]|uniref:LPD29 domain-containing protein n=1 Tax=Providencia sp. PROV033 TaxID=2949765 RepID=UPI002348F2D7|nr:LPD29 domain-containing protein [Providencia sp. PROV033]